MNPENTIVVPHAFASMRRFALDGALLLFDRDSGLNVLCDGPETEHLRQRAPRVVQFSITNRCNLACVFCHRDTRADSLWTADTAFQLLADLARAGTLEVAFGGGEPWAFLGFDGLIRRLHEHTPLAIGVTTNGLLLTRARLESIATYLSQIRVSLYDDNDWPRTLGLLSGGNVRFGVNWLVTPERLPGLETMLFDLVARGCRDVLLLSYNGSDSSRHLTTSQSAQLARRVGLIASELRDRCVIKLSVCWGERMESVPQLLRRGDCGAGRDFVVITSDQRVSPCSFHHVSLPASDAAEVLSVWRERHHAFASPSLDPGCARTPGFGLLALGAR